MQIKWSIISPTAQGSNKMHTIKATGSWRIFLPCFRTITVTSNFWVVGAKLDFASSGEVCHAFSQIFHFPSSQNFLAHQQLSTALCTRGNREFESSEVSDSFRCEIFFLENIYNFRVYIFHWKQWLIYHFLLQHPIHSSPLCSGCAFPSCDIQEHVWCLDCFHKQDMCTKMCLWSAFVLCGSSDGSFGGFCGHRWNTQMWTFSHSYQVFPFLRQRWTF